MRDTTFDRWFRGASLIIAFSLAMTSFARAESLDPALIPKIQAATFEVVSAKPETDPLTYDRPLPLDLLPFQERNDKFYPIGTAFSIGDNRYVTAAHVLTAVLGGLWGPPALRDSAGHVVEIGKIEKFSLDRDFVVFSLSSPADTARLEPNTSPQLNSVIYTVGNALGTGVVVRDGLYTSTTPEEQDGRWTFIRFSAAASPGNSGGPLLDKDGRVIGVVLRKSVNENLNYALPIEEVLKAPDHVAEADNRGFFRLAVSDATQIGTFKTQFSLPLGVAAFQAEWQARSNAFLDGQLAALLTKDPGNLFPNGAGSQRMLHSLSAANPYPMLMTRNAEGIWGPLLKLGPRAQLPGNGYIQSGQADRTLMYHWHRPDGVSAREAYSSPDRLMGDLLQTGFLHRAIGSEKVKITGLGKPSQDGLYTDRWQRRWQVRVWPLPAMNVVLVTLALPVPDGYAVMAQVAGAPQLHETMIGLKVNADFVNVGYEGTLAQWRDFLDDKPLVPAVFETVKISFAPGGAVHYASDRLSFSVPQDVQTSTPESVLTLGMSFFPGPDKPVWDTSVIRLKRTANDNDLVNIQRHIKPSGDIGNSYENNWDKVVNRKHPFDGVIRLENDITKIAAVAESPASGDAAPLYTVFLEVSGSSTQEAMKGRLESWLKDFHVTEP